MSNSYDVIVVGVGSMGAAACEVLSRRGRRVLGLEQFDIPHGMGAHHGQSRMFRTAYYEHSDYVPLLQHSLDLWRDLESRAGTQLLYLTGSLYVGPVTSTGHGGGELLPRSIEAAQRYHLVHHMLSHAELQRRFPMLRVPESYVGLLERDGGFILPERAVGAMAVQTIRNGGDLRGREPVLEWSADPSGVRVRTTRGTYTARSLILAGGPWSAKLCRGLGVEITISRQVLGWVQPRVKGTFDLGRFPCWAVEREDGALYYGFPELPWRPGFKTALHAKSRPCDPDTVQRGISAEDEAEVHEGLVRHLPDGDGPLLSMGVCMYDNSPDCHFILDRHPEHPNVVVGTGFSGHGFKFAPVIGEALADLAIEGRSSLPIGFLGLSRFAKARV